MNAIALKIASQGEKEIWFSMGEVCPNDARKWNDYHHKSKRDRLYVVDRCASQCAYVHYGPESKLPMICNGVVFDAKWCQFLKHRNFLFVVLRLISDTWDFPQNMLQIDDEVNDRAIDYHKLTKNSRISSLITRDPEFEQTLETVSPITIGDYKLKKQTKYLVSKHLVDILPDLHRDEKCLKLELHPFHCSFREWMDEKPWDIVSSVWFMVYCCYKKTNWYKMGDDFFREIQQMSTMDIRFSVPSCLELSAQKLQDKCYKHSCYAGDDMQNTEAHVHAKTKPNLNADFDPELWFRRNKYGMLPIHTAIMFGNSRFVDCFLLSKFGEHANKILFRFARSHDINVEQFQKCLSKQSLSV